MNTPLNELYCKIFKLCDTEKYEAAINLINKCQSSFSITHDEWINLEHHKVCMKFLFCQKNVQMRM